ncbi:TPA: DNA polymerase III subunit beta [Candidatus Taylorbacteria bacterium]|nr:DNA polymerase III subunit beta [Candidatus Taylorbacteria bacterium]
MAVPANVLFGFVSQISEDENIILEVVEKNLIVSSSSGKAVINSYNHDDFPTLPVVPKEKTFHIHAKDLVKGFKSVWYSASMASMKPELASVYVFGDDNEIYFVATDSFRLAEKKIYSKKLKDVGAILIPYKNVIEIVRIIDDVSDEIEVNLTKNQISFSFGGTYITSRVVEGVFPDYKQIIPKEFTTEVIVLKQDVIQALKLATIFSDAFHQVSLKVDPAKKLFQISTRNTEVGEHVHNLAAAITGDAITIPFNYKYIVDCFQSIEADSVSFQFNGLNRAMVMRGVSDGSFTYLVMPMNK